MRYIAVTEMPALVTGAPAQFLIRMNKFPSFISTLGLTGWLFLQVFLHNDHNLCLAVRFHTRFGDRDVVSKVTVENVKPTSCILLSSYMITF